MSVNILDNIKNIELKKIIEKLQCENPDFEQIKKEINEANPWKENIINDENNLNNNKAKIEDNDPRVISSKDGFDFLGDEKLFFRSIAIKDIEENKMLEFVKKEIKESIKVVESKKDYKYLSCEEQDELKRIIAKGIAMPFEHYEQSFDGNFDNPEVLILGINPRFKYDTFINEDGTEKELMTEDMFSKYKNPIDESVRPMLCYKFKKNEIINNLDDEFNIEENIYLHNDDYYYGKNGKFISSSVDKCSKKDFRKKCLTKNGITPLSFIELFPYASNGVAEWINKDSFIHLLKSKSSKFTIFCKNYTNIFKIKPYFKKFINLEELLYSQQWIIVLLQYLLYRNKGNKQFKIVYTKSFSKSADAINKMLCILEQILPEIKVKKKVEYPKVIKKNNEYHIEKSKVLLTNFYSIASGQNRSISLNNVCNISVENDEIISRKLINIIDEKNTSLNKKEFFKWFWNLANN